MQYNADKMKLFRHLYIQVLIATVVGAVIGALWPNLGISLKPLGDTFIGLIKMIVAPVIFCTVVIGVNNSGDMKKVGRVGAKAILYFEVVSTFALALGLLTMNLLKPGASFHADVASLDASAVSSYAEKAHDTSVVGLLTNIVPKTFFDAFSGSGDLLQVILVALLFGFAMSHIGEKARPVREFIASASQIFFKIINLLMRFAPLGALGSMAFTIGKFGLHSIGPLLALMASFYLTCLVFVFVVLGLIARWAGFNIFRFVWHVRGELMTILGTSSSESVLVPLMERLEGLGCSKSVVGLVVPAGYSFNLDGTNIYMTMAALFIAQALGIELTLSQQLSLLLVAMISSKGASGVTGAGFVTLAATLAAVPSIPVVGMALILGIDRFMSEARALTNFVGNGVAAIVVAKWEGELDVATLQANLRRPPAPLDDVAHI